ncbi:MAG: methyl-accepting chemotaxis protein [Spirochaetaceae bacterium]|nr:methyl-accepting chemotaxis protein [Spirochaetaceae bacterium]
MKWSISLKIGAGFVFGMAVLMAFGAVCFQMTNQLAAASELVTHSYRTIGKLEMINLTLAEAEGAVLRYTLTNDEAHLVSVNSSAVKLSSLVKDLRRLIVVDADQGKSLDDLETLVVSRLGLLEAALAKRQSTAIEVAREIGVVSDVPKARDGIRGITEAMVKAENIRLEARNAAESTRSGQMILLILIGTPVALVLVSLIALWLIRTISRPLRTMVAVAYRVAEGDLTFDTPISRRKDEIGVLMSAFRNMTENLREILRRTQEGIVMMNSSASGIMTTTAQIASGAVETVTGVNDTTVTVEQVKQTALGTREKAKAVLEGAQLSAQISDTGIKRVEETLSGMDRIREQMDFISGSIVQLSERSQAIGEITATMNELAEQSNLLAINAAIEATKAGEWGKGFAVVALEVKILAEKSKKATAQVRKILGDVQKAVGAAVLATEKGSDVVETGVRQSQEVSEVLRQLGKSIAGASRAALQISDSSQEQVQGVDHVMLAMASIQIASSKNVVGTRQAETAARQLYELGERLGQLVARYRLAETRDARTGQGGG